MFSALQIIAAMVPNGVPLKLMLRVKLLTNSGVIVIKNPYLVLHWELEALDKLILPQLQNQHQVKFLLVI